jgi:hypothetical protein
VLLALSITGLFAFAGLAVDASLFWTIKRHMQTATDAAAIAAATALRNGQNFTAAGADLSSFNGFTAGQNGVTVTINNPPASGAYAGDTAYVEAIVRQSQPTYFMRLLGYSSVNISSRAVAAAANGSYCMFALDPSASAAISTDNRMRSSCGVMANSSSGTAVRVAGSLTAPQIGIVGSTNDIARITGAVSTHVAPAPDPLAYIPAPPVGNCTATNYLKSSESWTLSPGVYCGGITLHGTATVTLNPGTYILNGGGLTVDGNAILNGTGVTFYNTGTSTTFKPIYTQDGNTLNLIAPTSGTYAGILFFQDRSITSSAANIIAGGSAKLEGALYFKNSPLVFSSQSAVTAAYTIIVAKTISNQVDTFSVANDYSSLAKGSPIKATVLFE